MHTYILHHTSPALPVLRTNMDPESALNGGEGEESSLVVRRWKSCTTSGQLLVFYVCLPTATAVLQQAVTAERSASCPSNGGYPSSTYRFHVIPSIGWAQVLVCTWYACRMVEGVL